MRYLICSLFILIITGTNAQDSFETAKTYYDKEDFRKALFEFSTFIAQDSSRSQAFYYRGNCYMELNHLPNAISDYRMATQLDSAAANAFFNLGIALSKEEKRDSAILCFNRFIELKPKETDGYVYLAANLSYEEDADSILNTLNRAFVIDSANVLVLDYLMQEHFSRGNYDKAIEYANRGASVDTLNATFFLTQAYSEYNLGNFETSTKICEHVLTLDSTNTEAVIHKIRSKLIGQTPPEELNNPETGVYKFVRYTSSKLSDSIASDSISDINQLMNRIKDGEILGLDKYFRFYIGQRSFANFSPYGMANEKISKLYNAEKYNELAAFNDKIFTKSPINLNDLYKVAVANYVIRDMKEFERLYTVYLGIIESILATGTGESYQEAFVAMSTRDEYAILGYLGFRSSGQSLGDWKGIPFDILRVQLDENDHKEIYFNIQAFYGHLFSDFGAAPKKKKRKKK